MLTRSILRGVAIGAALWPLAALAEPTGSTPVTRDTPVHGHAATLTVPGLSPEEMVELREGRGMGLARVADVLDYPGPGHVLDAWTGGQLTLRDGQAARITEIHAAMAQEAQHVGARVLHVEQDLADALRDGTIDAEAMARRVDRIAALRGTLRAVHLRARLETRTVLDPAQVARYGALRGHAPDTGGHGHGR